MPDISPVLGLPYLQAAQAQKHVTHNEALRILDAITQLSVLSADLATPPPAPQEGDRYIVAATASGDWAGRQAHIAVFSDAIWHFFPPRAGWRADVGGAGSMLRFDGTDWQPVTPPDTMPLLGINAPADAVNRLAVSSAATLLGHDGAGHQVKVNKATTGDTASLLFQTGWSGRAEMGTTGSDDFAIKVSPDGSLFHTVMTASAANGALQLPSGQIYFRDVFIPNDSAHSFDVPFSNPARILMWLAVNLAGHHFLFSITGTLSGASNFAAMFSNPPGKMVFHTGTLSGTTGPAACINLSISTSGSVPRMYVENRLGTNRLFTLATLGR